MHKHTTLGFDKKSRYKVSITIADSSCEAWRCCQKQTRQWIDPLLMTPEDGVICGHHVLGYDQWYTRLMLLNLTLYQPGLPAGEMYMQLWDNAEQYMSYIIIYCHSQRSPDTRTGKGPPPPCIWTFFASVVCLCTYLTFKTHSTIPTFVMVFAGKLFISLVSEVLWSVAI